MKKFRLYLEAMFAVLALALVTLFCVYAFRTNSEGAAAWIQAVGSIAAIIAAWRISTEQYRRDQKLSERRRLEERIQTLETVHGIMLSISGAAVVSHLNRETLFPDRKATDEERFSAVIHYGDALKEAPLFDLGDARVVSFVVQVSWLVERLKIRMGQGVRFPWTSADEVVLRSAITEVQVAVDRLKSEMAQHG
jgi:hypothetical protein